jgi:hypothetical protein
MPRNICGVLSTFPVNKSIKHKCVLASILRQVGIVLCSSQMNVFQYIPMLKVYPLALNCALVFQGNVFVNFTVLINHNSCESVEGEEWNLIRLPASNSWFKGFIIFTQSSQMKRLLTLLEPQSNHAQYFVRQCITQVIAFSYARHKRPKRNC